MVSPLGTGRVRKFFHVALLAIGLLQPALYWRSFSGDAQIHLVYARNLLRGYPLQFNLHAPNSGETTMGFMFIVAVCMRTAGETFAPYIVKILCLFSLYAGAFLTLKLARRVGLHSDWDSIAALAFLWMPGNVSSAMSGSENVVFAAASLAFVYRLWDSEWFLGRDSHFLIEDVSFALMAGVLFWLRPETFPLVLIVLAVSFLGHVQQPETSRAYLLGVIVFVLVFAAIVIAYVALFRHFSGELPYAAGKARRVLSSLLECSSFLGITINGKILLRIGAYASVVAPAFLSGAMALRRRDWPTARRLKIAFLFAVFFLFLLAYLFNILPGVHFARYSIFIWPCGLMLAALFLQEWMEKSPSISIARAWVMTVLLLSFLAAAGYETILRRRFLQQESQSELEEVAHVPERRDAITRELISDLGIPQGANASVALQEVQLRYRLGDNITVNSLDGITDSRFLNFVCGTWIDHDGYLIDSRTDFLMEFPDLNRDKSRWSLAQLESLPVGASVVRPGITYTRISPDIVRVHRTVEHASDRPGGICGS